MISFDSTIMIDSLVIRLISTLIITLVKNMHHWLSDMQFQTLSLQINLATVPLHKI